MEIVVELQSTHTKNLNCFFKKVVSNRISSILNYGFNRRFIKIQYDDVIIQFLWCKNDDDGVSWEFVWIRSNGENISKIYAFANINAPITASNG